MTETIQQSRCKQVWKIGDCLQLLPEIPDKSINMILTDLPYGVTEYKWDVIIPLEPLWAQYERIITDAGAIVLTATQPFSSLLVMSNPNIFKYEWIWEKSRQTGFMNARHMPLKSHEEILVFSKSRATSNQFTDTKMKYNPQGVRRSNTIAKGKTSASAANHHRGNLDKNYKQTLQNFPTSILKIPSELNTVHPTQKPVALFEYLIKTYTNEGDTVLDSCLGSGTTLVACRRTNRNGIGFEINPDYEPIIKKRLMADIPLLEAFF